MGEQTGIRIGVVGVGGMGGHHARIAASLPGAVFVGVYDADPARAEQIVAQHGGTAFISCAALCENADAVIVATPTATHAAVATACLDAGCHVLLEKPIAATVAEAEALAAHSARRGHVLMIGHVERFNPAVAAALAQVPADAVFALEAQRLSPVPGRDQSADVIGDLMIHDLDLVLACVPAPPVTVAAAGQRLRGGLIDHATALVRYANGAVATLTASAVSQQRTRRLRLFTADAVYVVDCGRKTLHVLREGAEAEHIPVPPDDALTQEQLHFLQAIRQGMPPMTDAEAGLRALRLAETIRQRIEEPLAVPIA